MIIAIILIIIFLIILGINLYVKEITKSKIVKDIDDFNVKDIDCIFVLGAGVRNEKPTDMLEDRIKQSIILYKKNISPKIIMSGDHGRDNYDEVNIMKQYAIKEGVPSEDIFMDHAGFSTYESIYRAKEIFGVKKAVIVTQKYHLYRSLYIAKKFGIEVYGVGANLRKYMGMTYRWIREILARNKDFFKCILKPKPTYLGDKISLSGSGDVTNDKD